MGFILIIALATIKLSELIKVVDNKDKQNAKP